MESLFEIISDAGYVTEARLYVVQALEFQSSSLTSLTHCVAPKVLEYNNSLVSMYLIAYSFEREPLEYEY